MIQYTPTWGVFKSLLVIFFLWFLFRMYLNRTSVKGLPTPPHNIFLGHLPVMAKMSMKLPSDVHAQVLMSAIHREYNFKEFFVLDNWPAPGGAKIMIIADPALAMQVTQGHSFPKHPRMKHTVGHLIGEDSLITLEGPKWKALRQMYNPGLSLNHLMTLVDGMVDDTLVFYNILTKYAYEKKPFCLEEAATRLTFDIVGRVTLDLHLNSQTTDNELVSSFRASALWTPSAGPIEIISRFNLIRPFVVRYYSRKMDNYIGKVLNDRVAAGKDTSSKPNRRKSVVDRAIEEFNSENGATSTTVESAAFKRSAIDTIKTFLFAGHDTTSSTIAYIYYLLFKHPEALNRLITEHAEVFGNDLAAVPDKIKAEPHLLNKLHFTLAVIKETLRLYPAGSTVREGNANAPLRLADGSLVSTDGYMVWVVHHTIGRRADLFPSPDSFIPERFLPATEYPPPSERIQESIPKDAWRPFERGPRNCVGQELALLETKLILVMTLSKFDIRPAYDALDRGETIDGMSDQKKVAALGGIRQVDGERAYQIFKATAKPSDGMPVTVRMRN